jgi:MarR family transcriptional regulator, organic hydroperoxide resistance regulator
VENTRAYIARLAPLLPQLVFAFRRRRGEVPEVLKRAGRQGERHISVLMSLAIRGPASVSELAERTDMSPAHASLVVGELARAGLVDRDHDESDRRLIIVSLSDAAKPAVGEMRNRNAAPLLRFLGELEEDEADQFITLLARLVAYMRDEPPPPAGEPAVAAMWDVAPTEATPTP